MAKELEIPLESYFRLDQQVNDATLLSLEDLSIASEADWERAQEKYTDNPFLDPLSFVESKDLVEKLASAWRHCRSGNGWWSHFTITKS